MRSISPHIAWLAAVALGASPARAAGGDFVTKSQHIGWVTTHHPPRSLRHRLGEDLKNRQLEAGIALTVMRLVPSL